MQYLLLTSPYELADVAATDPHKTIVLVEDEVGQEARARICAQLVTTGCRYAMTWGNDCRAWQDAINLANLQAFGFDDIPDDQLIITTSHPDEALADVFWFAKYTAMHPCHALTHIQLLHIGSENREKELLGQLGAV